MSDAVMVPRAWLEAFRRDTDPTEPIADNGGTVWDMFCHEAAAMLAASPSVGGWEDDPYLATDLALVNDLIYQHGGDAALAGWVRLCRRITAAPPPVSTGSRPQEAVPTEQAEPAVVGDEGWIKWDGGECPVRGQRVDTRHQRGDECHDWLADQWGYSWLCEDPEDGENIIAYRIAPQPADGCSSNEGAGQ